MSKYDKYLNESGYEDNEFSDQSEFFSKHEIDNLRILLIRSFQPISLLSKAIRAVEKVQYNKPMNSEESQVLLGILKMILGKDTTKLKTFTKAEL